MPHALPHPHEGADHQLPLGWPEAAAAELAIGAAGLHDAPHHGLGLGVAGAGGQGAQGGFAAVGQHQDRRFAAAGIGAPVAEALFGNAGLALAGLVEEVAHLEGALVLRDEVGQGARQAVAAGEFEALIHVGLEDGGAGEGVVEFIVGIGAVLLVLDEPLGAMELAHVVIERAGAHQIHIGTDRPRPLFRQARDHQGVLEGARRLARQAPQQGPFQIGQLQQPGAGEQVEEAFHHRCQQQTRHQQATHHQRLAHQIDGRHAPGLAQQRQLQQQPLQQQGSGGEQHRELQQLSPAALAARQHRGTGRHRRTQQQAFGHQGTHGLAPQQRCTGQPGQTAGGAQPLGQQQGGWHQQHQGAGQGPQPEPHRLHRQQNHQAEQGLTRLQAGFPAPLQQHHQRRRRGCFEEVAHPGQGSGTPVHQPEVIEHVEGLLADRFPLAGDQIPLGHREGGDALLGDQFFDAPLAQGGIGAQVGLPLQGVADQAGPQGAGHGWLAFQLQVGGGEQLALGHTAAEPLAEHAQLGLAHIALPAGQGLGRLAAQPLALLAGERDRFHLLLGAGGQLLDRAQAVVELLLQELAGLRIHHQHGGAGEQFPAAAVEGAAVDHAGVFGGPGGEGGRHAGLEAWLHQPWPAGQQPHQQAGDRHAGGAAGAPGGRRGAGPLQPQGPPPEGSQPPL